MIRAAREQDLPRIMAIYDAARRYKRQTGNPTQWGDNYPPEPMLRQDIACGRLFVMEDTGGVYAVFAFILGEDPTYRRIQGAWRDDSPYGTIHRIASDGVTKGIARTAFDFAAGKIDYLRIDTHENNRPMQAAVLRYGFQPCGIVQVRGGARLAFDYEVRA